MRAFLFASAALLAATPALAQHEGHGEAQDHSAHQQEPEVVVEHVMIGALGRYAAAREASGTAWQPDASAGHGASTTSPATGC